MSSLTRRRDKIQGTHFGDLGTLLSRSLTSVGHSHHPICTPPNPATQLSVTQQLRAPYPVRLIRHRTKTQVSHRPCSAYQQGSVCTMYDVHTYIQPIDSAFLAVRIRSMSTSVPTNSRLEQLGDISAGTLFPQAPALRDTVCICAVTW